ncbi:MAG: helix-turn-helix domain-containing protein [Patescibacteria group bacterium]
MKQKLIEFGFSDKEASVYLAMIELGPSSVQDVAKKAGVNRATTYVMIESLKRRGLMSSVEQGKKILFAAESPEHLLAITRAELDRVDERRRGLEALMPQFMALFNAVEDKPRVRFFEGEEGIVAAREVLGELSKGHDACFVFMHYDAAMLKMAEMDEANRLRLLRTTVQKIRMLYSLDEGTALPQLPANIMLRRIPALIQSFRGECNIYDDFVMLADASPRPMAIIIQSKEFATLLRSMFELAWASSAIPA